VDAAWPPVGIVYAGALHPKKNAFVYQLGTVPLEPLRAHLYGKGYDQASVVGEASRVTYKGFFPFDELMQHIDGSFGLVWDGESVETCSGVYGDYLRYNHPHKCSFYLACGLPVIVWSESAVAEFVRREGVGLCVESLGEISGVMQGLSESAYRDMVQRVGIVRDRVRSGFYLSAALEAAIAEKS